MPQAQFPNPPPLAPAIAGLALLVAAAGCSSPRRQPPEVPDPAQDPAVGGVQPGDHGAGGVARGVEQVQLAVREGEACLAAVDALVNGGRLSAVMAINCSSAAIDFNAIGERFVSSPDGGATWDDPVALIQSSYGSQYPQVATDQSGQQNPGKADLQQDLAGAVVVSRARQEQFPEAAFASSDG